MKSCSAHVVPRQREPGRTPRPASSIGNVAMKSIASCNSLFSSLRVRRVITGSVGRAAPDPGGVHGALRRAERPAPCCPAWSQPFSAWSARPGPLGCSAGHVLPGPEGSVLPVIWSDIVARWKYIPNRRNCSSNDIPPLPLLLGNGTIKRTCVLKSSTSGAGGLAPPPARGSALERAIRSGTTAILTDAFASLSALAPYAHAGRAASRWWVRSVVGPDPVPVASRRVRLRPLPLSSWGRP